MFMWLKNKSKEEIQLFKFSIFAACIYFVQSTGSIGGVASNSILFYMKEGLGFDQVTMSYYFALIGVAWLIKPVFGLLSDLFPIYGYRRKSYIYITNILAISIWWFMAYICYMGLLNTFWWITLPLIILGLMFAITDIAADGLTVQTSQEAKKEGDLQAVQWSGIYLGLMLTTVFSVWLAKWAMPDTGKEIFEITKATTNKLSIIFLITSLFPLVNLITCYFLVKEEKVRLTKEQIKQTLSNLWNAIKEKKIWILIVCIFMLHFSPGFNAPLWYYIRDYCGPEHGQMPKMWFAWISMWDKAMALIGIYIFKKYWKKINFELCLYVSLIVGFIATLCYLWIDSFFDIIIVGLCFGSIAGFIHVLFLTIAAKNTPKLVEGIIFAAYCSIFNLANTASNSAGGWLFGKVNTGGQWFEQTWKYTSWLTNFGVSENMVGLRILLIVSALFTLCTIIFIPLLFKYCDK